MYTLGINAAFHDPAACLVKDGEVIAAAEEERFNHVKHGKRASPFTAYEIPFHAIDFCLREAEVTIRDIAHVAYSFDPFELLGSHQSDATIALPLEPSAHPIPEEWLSAWDPLFLSSIVNAPRHLAGGVPHHLGERLCGHHHDGPFRWHFVPHHVAHAASAYFPSPFDHAAILSLDGRGERAATSYARGQGSALDMLDQVDIPNSLGLLYEEVTDHLGFLRSSDEYKVMALASYGEPRYLAELESLVTLLPNGQYRLAPLQLESWFGPRRHRGGPLESRHFDLARSLQGLLQKVVLQLAQWLHESTGETNLCLAGGVALNCVLNAHLRDRSSFSNIWVQPAAGDAGTAVGAALWVHERHHVSRNGVKLSRPMSHAYLGPSYLDEEIEQFLKWTKVSYRRMQDVPRETAALLAEDRIIGWFQGRMEFGPRALGARSILASPINAEMQARLNEIKDREEFRPVAPVVLEEVAGEWFERAGCSPFMLFVNQVMHDKAERIPAVRHVDGTARIQTVSRTSHPLLHDLIQAFAAQTEVPVLINTSFNTRGEPIVCSPRDALECFWTSPLDALVIGSYCIEKDR